MNIIAATCVTTTRIDFSVASIQPMGIPYRVRFPKIGED